MSASENCRKILVVDDDRDLAHLLCQSLRDHGHVVIAAENADEALAAVVATPPDLAILDIRMQGKSGLQLAKLLREQFQVPFVFLTAVEDEQTVREATATGALAYLVKHQDVSQYFPTIDAALARAAEFTRLRRSESQLANALQQNRHISLATGVLMERLRLDREAAFTLLRDEARARRRRLNELAEELVRATETVNALKPGGSSRSSP
jgi:response regulator NasT